MKLTITKTFINVLKDAFALSTSKEQTENYIMLKSNKNESYLFALDKGNSLLCRYDVSDCCFGEEECKTILTKRLSDFLNYYTNDFPEDLYIEIEKEKVNVYINNKKQLSLNFINASTDAFEVIDSNVSSLTRPAFNVKQVASDAVKFVASDKTYSIGLQGVQFDFKKDFISVSSTNGIFMYNYKSSSQCTQELKKIIPASSLKKILKYFESDVEILSDAGVILFKTGRVFARLNTIDSSFPDVEKVLSLKGERDAKINVKNTYENVMKTAVTAADNLSCVKFTLDSNSLKIASDNKEFGNAEIYMDCKYNKTKTEIWFSIGHLLECLSTLKSEIATFYFNDNTPVIMEEDNVKIAIMPLDKGLEKE